MSYIEIIIYASVLGMITLVMINGVLALTGSYRNLSVMRNIEHTAMDVLERLSRDIRGATSVNAAQSVFNSSNGILTLVSTDSGVSTTTKYYLANGVVNLDVNDVFSGPLSSVSSTITDMTFYLISTENSSAVRIDLTVQSTDGNITKVKTYHNTVTLKQS